MALLNSIQFTSVNRHFLSESTYNASSKVIFFFKKLMEKIKEKPLKAKVLQFYFIFLIQFFLMKECSLFTTIGKFMLLHAYTKWFQKLSKHHLARHKSNLIIWRDCFSLQHKYPCNISSFKRFETDTVFSSICIWIIY